MTLTKRALTTGEVAGYCGVNFRTVLRWIERGQLKAYQLPGRGDNRIEMRDFLGFLQENHMPVPEKFQGMSRQILIVEDEPLMAKTLQRTLNRAGYQTQHATDGFSAGALLASWHPTLMTLDLNMPGLGGMQVLEFLKNNPDYKHLKILVISASSETEMQQARAAGAHDTLEKPFSNSAFLEKIERLLST